ncbi:MAG TPA: hypothetical protein VE309_02845 [Caulobacteraceae bacterium]|jgi:hypothetical protein|nr:hypothetical protein [Caulobacteraceae bacterium]
MTPTAPELLGGCVVALATPPKAEEMGPFMAGTVGIAALLDMLAAQECATGSAARVWENAALRGLFAEAAGAYDARLGGALASSGEVTDGDYSLAALDAANAELRRRLIRLHEAVEAARDAGFDRRILVLYRDMAARRELQLPPMPG